MELVINENSYVSLEEADTIVKEIYLSKDENITFWEGLSDDDKTTLIIYATAKLENPRNLWIGSPAKPNSKMAFPRIEYKGNIAERILDFNRIMKIGLMKLCIEGYRLEKSDENSMIEKGISSYKIKDASVTFDVSDRSKVMTETNIPMQIWKMYFAQYSLIS